MLKIRRGRKRRRGTARRAPRLAPRARSRRSRRTRTVCSLSSCRTRCCTSRCCRLTVRSSRRILAAWACRSPHSACSAERARSRACVASLSTAAAGASQAPAWPRARWRRASQVRRARSTPSGDSQLEVSRREARADAHPRARTHARTCAHCARLRGRSQGHARLPCPARALARAAPCARC